MNTRKKAKKDDLTAVENFIKRAIELSRVSPIEIDENDFLEIEALELCENCHALPNGRMFQGFPPEKMGLKCYFVKIADEYFAFIDEPNMTPNAVLEMINTFFKIEN
jgi:hypothetical protein